MNKNIFKKILRGEEGQGMTEYIIIVALIGIAAIGVVTLFGDNIRDLFGSSAAALSGNEDIEREFGDDQRNEARHRDLHSFSKADEAQFSALQ